MSSAQRGLGRGIDTLFRNSPSDAATVAKKGEITKLPIGDLVPCAAQPRKIFEDRPLSELAESIKHQGIIQPLLVRPLGNNKFEIVAGERRYRAAKIAGLAEIPVVVREMSDQEAMTAALVENLQREDLNPIEEAEAMQALRESLNITQDELATRLGKSRSAVSNTMRLLQLTLPMREALIGENFTPGHARAILSIQDPEAQQQLFEFILQKNLTVRDAENAALHLKQHGTLPDNISNANPQKARGARAAKPEIIQDAQLLLRAAVHPKVTVSGSGEIGRVTIPYDSSEALAELLRRFGTEMTIPNQESDDTSASVIAESQLSANKN